MARWADMVTLISIVLPEKKTDADGFDNPAQEVKAEVFCNRRSVGQTEYYKAQQAGKKAEAKVEVHTADYSGETLAELDGKRYSVLKTYEPPDSDIVELTLTDVTEAAEAEAEATEGG